MNPVHNADYLSMNIDTDDGYRSLDKAMNTAVFYHISRPEAEDIIKMITETVAGSWRKLATKYGIRKDEQKRMAPAFALAEH